MKTYPQTVQGEGGARFHLVDFRHQQIGRDDNTGGVRVVWESGSLKVEEQASKGWIVAVEM